MEDANQQINRSNRSPSQGIEVKQIILSDYSNEDGRNSVQFIFNELE